jgi:hypothetical protein
MLCFIQLVAVIVLGHLASRHRRAASRLTGELTELGVQ